MPNEIIRISQSDFDSLRLINNNVAIEIIHRNAEEKTKSGLIIVQDPAMFSVHDIKAAEEYNLSQHLDRWGRVAKIPERLVYAKHNKMFGMDWETEIEIQIGDIVWADYYNLHHCPIFRVYDKDNFDKIKDSYKDYWVITYDCLIVAKRPYNWRDNCTIGFSTPTKESFDGKNSVSFMELDECGMIGDPEWRKEKIIPLNGYCLFTQINEGLQSKFLELPKEINKKKGIVKYTGSKNKEYSKVWDNASKEFKPSKHFDDIDIEPGDEVVFRTESECLLENEQHQYFEKENLRYEQRKNVLGVKKCVPL